jgi:hypothetical protein
MHDDGRIMEEIESIRRVMIINRMNRHVKKKAECTKDADPETVYIDMAPT